MGEVRSREPSPFAVYLIHEEARRRLPSAVWQSILERTYPVNADPTYFPGFSQPFQLTQPAQPAIRIIVLVFIFIVHRLHPLDKLLDPLLEQAQRARRRPP